MNKKMIPLVKTYMSPREELMPAIEKTLYSGYTAVGEATGEFERKLSICLDSPYVVALNSGTAALHIALELIGIQPGDEVISTPMTAEPTNTVILNAGGKVVWGDVDPNTGLLDPVDVEKKITERTKAIMLVHYAGMVCDMEAFLAISQRYGIPIIEDCAHALGACYKGRRVGSFSDFGCYSFQSIKHLTTIDGGAIVFGNNGMVGRANGDLLDEALKLRFFGLSKKVSRLENDITRVGYKYGMNNVNATIGLVQFEHMDDIVNRHISNGKYYDESLAGIDGVDLITYSKDTEPSYWLYTMMVENRSDFIRMMEDNGVTASTLHHRSDTHSCFADSKCDLPGMNEWYEKFVHIPCGWWVSSEDREYIVDCIKRGW